MLDHIDDKRLIFVTGKGGVGKSTVVAALGRALAREGKRTLVAETDAYSAMQELLDVPLSESSISTVDGPLHAVNLESSECFVNAISRFLPSRRIVRAVVGNRIARVFFNAAPGVNEFAILDQLGEILDGNFGHGEHWDHIIVDLPASGHAVTFLSVAQTFENMIKVGPIAERASELARLVADESNTAICAVCLPEEMPVNETIELEDKMESTLKRGLTAVYANMVHRAPLDAEREEQFNELIAGLNRDHLLSQTIGGDPDDQDAVQRVIAGNVLALDWHERDDHYMGELHEGLSAPIVELPVFYEPDGGEIVERMVDHLLGEDEPSTETLAS